MSRPEQTFWRNVVQPALADIQHLEYDRIESSVAANGFPDVVYTFGATGFIENKWSSGPKAGALDLSIWREDQRRWARKVIKAGATVFLFIGGPADHRLVRVDEPLTHLEFLKVRDPRIILQHGSTVGAGKLSRAELARALWLGPKT